MGISAQNPLAFVVRGFLEEQRIVLWTLTDIDGIAVRLITL